MKEATDIRSIGRVDGINKDASYTMKIAPNGQLWFIGGTNSTQIYRFDGLNAYKWEINEAVAEGLTKLTFSENEVFFNVSHYTTPNPTVLKINENSAEKWICEDLINHVILSMVYTQMGLVCLFTDHLETKIRIWKTKQFIPLEISEPIEEITLLDLTSDGHLLILGEKKGIVYDVANEKVLNTFSTYRSQMKFITCGKYNISYCDTRIEIRDSIGHLIDDIDTFGQSEHPISKIIESIDSKDYVDIQNIAYIDDEHILIHFIDRQGNKRHYLRVLHIPTMSLDFHPLDGCLKSKQPLYECYFDKSGALWLNQYTKNDCSKFIVMRQGPKKPYMIDKASRIFKP